MKTINYLIFAVLVAVIFSGCSGKDGATGAPGNANVVGTNYTTITWNEDSNDTYWYAELQVNALNSSILQFGAVEVYFSNDNGNSWTAMPSTYVNSTLSANYFWSYTSTIGNVEVDWIQNSSSAGDNPPTVYGTNIIFKVVCIAPFTLHKYPHTNWKDYNQVQTIMAKEGTLNDGSIVPSILNVTNSKN